VANVLAVALLAVVALRVFPVVWVHLVLAGVAFFVYVEGRFIRPVFLAPLAVLAELAVMLVEAR
jgi:hypothetical protein